MLTDMTKSNGNDRAVVPPVLHNSSTQKSSTAQGYVLAPWGGGLLLAGAAVAAGVLGYALLVEPMRIELANMTIRLPHLAGHLPAGGLRILQLTDSHFQGGSRLQRERRKIERIAGLTRGLQYDLLVHTGDFIHLDDGVENVLCLLDAVPAPRLGAFGVFGNHDYTHYAMREALPRMWRTFRTEERRYDAACGSVGRLAAAGTRWLRYVRYVRNTPLDGRRVGSNDSGALTAALTKWGMTVLHNRALHLHWPKEGLDLYLAGVDDILEGRPHLGNSLRIVPDGAPIVLLSHNPDIIASPQLPRVDVVLSGHTHGGQIVVPFWGPAHTQVEHLPRRHVAGYFRQGRTHVYVSRGLGEGIPLRFRVCPQITLIHLTA